MSYSSIEPPLHPIVIPALTYAYHNRTYTCLGAGLITRDHQKFDLNYHRYLPRLTPVLTKAGHPAARQPKTPTQPLAYWKAQCEFRGLADTGTVAELQARLRGFSPGGAVPEWESGMVWQLEEAEGRLNKVFLLENARARDDKWNRLGTDEEKVQEDPERWLREKFPEGGKGRAGAVVMKTEMRRQLHEAAERVGLCTESVNAPLNEDGTRQEVERWIVIGRDRKAVVERIQEVMREAKRVKQRVFEGKKKEVRKAHEAVTKAAKKGAWDVTGKWAISCPKIEDNWGGQGGDDELTMDIGFSNGKDGKKQMWARFNWNILTGVMRFVKPVGKASSSRQKGKAAKASSSNGKRRRTDDEGDGKYDEHDEYDEYDEDGEDNEFRRSPTPEEFYIGEATPSPACLKWNFRWRGEETGEGEIQLYSDQKLCEVTFSGPGGTKLTGIFESDLTGRIEFTGCKTDSGQSSFRYDINNEWDSRSEAAYESACVGRWH